VPGTIPREGITHTGSQQDTPPVATRRAHHARSRRNSASEIAMMAG